MDGSGSNSVIATDAAVYRSYLAACKPATLLKQLQQASNYSPPEEITILRARALIELDQYSEAENLLRKISASLQATNQPEFSCLWAQVNLRVGRVDEAVLTALRAVKEAHTQVLRSQALAWVAAGYARKMCWVSAQHSLQEALTINPNDSSILAVQARIFLDSDQRTAAQAVYERLCLQPDTWGQVIGFWGLSYVSYLMGDFDRASEKGLAGLLLSPEAILPVYVLVQVNLARNDLPQAERYLKTLIDRSPSADGLENLSIQLAQLRNRIRAGSLNGRRLASFPSLVQRRNHCGPSTIELVLRYWQQDTNLSDDQIADWVKTPQSGSPMHKMREFFLVLGYEAVRAFLPAKKLKHLVDLGIPVIIQEEFPNNSHVVVVIGYDELNHRFDIQDPMTHFVLAVDESELEQRRRVFLESGLAVFPGRLGLADQLAASGIFNHPALLWTDQAVIELDAGNFLLAVRLLEQSVRRVPGHALSWVMLLFAWLEIWKGLSQGELNPGAEDSQLFPGITPLTLPAVKRRFLKRLNQALEVHPDNAFIYHLKGQAKLIEVRYKEAQKAFTKAVELDPENPVFHLSIAECNYALRDVRGALSASRRSLELDPAAADGNAWMARCISAVGGEDAVYYAKAAIEINTESWLGHLALAEIYLQENEFYLATEELQIARELNPDEPDIEIFWAALAVLKGEYQTAAGIFNTLSHVPASLKPASNYLLRKFSCLLEFERGNYTEAETRARDLLVLYPQDPWGLQYLAASASESVLNLGGEIEYGQIHQVQDLFEAAVSAQSGYADVVSMYIQFLVEAGYRAEGLQVLDRLILTYKEQAGPYLLLKARFLEDSGSIDHAVKVLQQAFDQPDAIQSHDQLQEVFRILMAGLSLVEFTDLILGNLAGSMDWTTLPVDEVERSLALLIAPFQEVSDQAFSILQRVYERNPKDFEVLLAMGESSPKGSNQEFYFRQAVLAKPDSLEAREVLVNCLLSKQRLGDVLDLTVGCNGMSSSLKLARARALAARGFFEQAVPLFVEVMRESQEMDDSVCLEAWEAECRCGWFDVALQLVRDVLKQNRQDPAWLLRAAVSSLELSQYDQAFSYLQKALANDLSESDRLHFEYRAYILQGFYLEALQSLYSLHAIQDQKDFGLSLVEIEIIQVLALLKEHESIWNFVNNRRLDAAGWASVAQATFMSDSFPLAAEFAQKALSIDRTNALAMQTLGLCLYEQGQIRDSKAVFQTMHSQYPRAHTPYEFLALEAILNGQFEDAFEYADQAVNLGAFSANAWAVRGLVGFTLGHQSEALSDLEIAWNRLDFRSRSRKPVFWAVLSYLHQSQEDSRSWLNAAASRKADRTLAIKLKPFLNWEISP